MKINMKQLIGNWHSQISPKGVSVVRDFINGHGITIES